MAHGFRIGFCVKLNEEERCGGDNWIVQMNFEVNEKSNSSLNIDLNDVTK